MNCEHAGQFHAEGNTSDMRNGLCIDCWKARAEEWEKKAKEIALAHGRTSVDWSNELSARQKAEAELETRKRCHKENEAAFQQMKERAEKSEAACAEMRSKLDWTETLLCNVVPMQHCSQQEWDKLLKEWRDWKHSLPSDCGKGWLSPSKVSEIRNMIYEPDIIRVSKDGNKWCAIIGENLQVGIAGFGNTPSEAVVELTKHDSFSEWSNNLH